MKLLVGIRKTSYELLKMFIQWVEGAYHGRGQTITG
jgi:hypothetical protein